jgi:hypothetical protein
MILMIYLYFLKMEFIPEIREFLTSNYNENPEYVAFKNEDEMQEFYNDMGIDSVKFPFNFGIKKV